MLVEEKEDLEAEVTKWSQEKNSLLFFGQDIYMQYAIKRSPSMHFTYELNLIKMGLVAQSIDPTAPLSAVDVHKLPEMLNIEIQ